MFSSMQAMGIVAIYIFSCSLATAIKPSIQYDTALEILWGNIYADGGETLYCGVKFSQKKQYDLNAEHVFPMSWVTKSLKCGKRASCRKSNTLFNEIEADLHNIWPTLTYVNYARSSYRFAIIRGENHQYKNCDFEINHKRRQIEPRQEVRGDIARSMFYMKNQYNLAIFPDLGKLLLSWHKQDPVSEHEKYRNKIILRYQGRSNRYIDKPNEANNLKFSYPPR